MAEETQVAASVETVEKTEQTTETPKAEGGDGSTTAVTGDGKEQITIFHNKDNFSVKHPLMNKWTLWFTKPPSGKVCLWDRLSLFEGIFTNVLGFSRARTTGPIR
jgi:translation initiation factor 4E